ncbi:hypothetical protein [Buttiauxella noackiae]|uniref:hypothetical protein n=1 Tax=Buttiauxella noackiae TaxID=82992 RepID=UPI00055748BF|nr:hypothetical protein [Buttiauxella noackiae]
MKLYFTIFPKKTPLESYFLRDSTIKLNRLNKNDVQSLFRFERAFSTIAHSIGLDKTEQDRVRKIEQRLPKHTLIGVARWEISIPGKAQTALCYLFVCENNVAYLSAPDMTFTGDIRHIEPTNRRSVYTTTYKLTKPERKFGYVNLRFDNEFTLLTQRRGTSKKESHAREESIIEKLTAENEALRKKVKELLTIIHSNEVKTDTV